MIGSRQIVSKEMLTSLENFTQETIVNSPPVNTAARALLRDLKIFMSLDEKEQQNEIEIERLRKLFMTAYHNNKLPVVYAMEISFRKLIYNIMVSLAEHFPVNKDIDSETGLFLDPILFTPIKKEDQFFTMTGHVFSIDSIIEYNKTRPLRDDMLHERNGKYLLNPLTNQPFLPLDMERLIIIVCINKKDLNLDFIIAKTMESKNELAEFSEAFSLKQLVKLAGGMDLKLSENLENEFDYTRTDAIACITMAANNKERKIVSYLYSLLGPDSRALLENPEALGRRFVFKDDSVIEFIFLSAIFNEPKTFKQLADLAISGGIDLNQYKGGHAVIHIAAQYGSIDVMRVLLEPKYNIDINSRDSVGATAVGRAAQKNQINMIRFLAENGANLMIPRYDGTAPIHIAAEDNNTELMKLLLAFSVQINQKTAFIKGNTTPAHIAADRNSREITLMLLNAGADFGILNAIGATPLHYAAYVGAVDVMALLLQYKDRVFVNKAVEGVYAETAATLAAEHGHVRLLELFAEEKVDLTQPRMDDGTTALHRAVLENQYDATVFLINHYLANQTSIFVKHKAGQSPFHFACAKENWIIAKLFLNKVREEDIPECDKKLIKDYREELGIVSPSIYSSSRLFQEKNEYIDGIAKFANLDYAFVLECFNQKADGRFERIHLLSGYLHYRNMENKEYPSLNLDEVLATTLLQAENLRIAYPLIYDGALSIDQVKEFSEQEGKNIFGIGTNIIREGLLTLDQVLKLTKTENDYLYNYYWYGDRSHNLRAAVDALKVFQASSPGLQMR